jgi:signal transduction histidine kinase
MVPHQVGHIDVNIQRLGSNVEIRVSDNGPGIPECIREKLFQPFVSHGKQHGSGLGLAIVQKACFDHNGTVVLENSSPEGTTFRIVLPARAPAGAVESGPSKGPGPHLCRPTLLFKVCLVHV